MINGEIRYNRATGLPGLPGLPPKLPGLLRG